jgi:DNA-binding transcriptional ArsR family regulator
MAVHARRSAESWDHATDVGLVARVIGSPRCLEVLIAVLRVDRTVTELSEDLGLEGCRVSQCLGRLLGAGLVAYRRDGKLHAYGPSPNAWVAESANRRTVFVLRDTRGSAFVFEPSPEELDELVRNDRRRAEPFLVTRQAPDLVVRSLRPSAVPGPPEGAPTLLRPPSGRGSE